MAYPISDPIQILCEERDVTGRLAAAERGTQLPAAGTYHCRTVAGSRAISMHDYGAAIDINTKHADYWRWAGERGAPRWRNRNPGAIVRIFETHGYIWGGSRYHYDTIHIAYRTDRGGSA